MPKVLGSLRKPVQNQMQLVNRLQIETKQLQSRRCLASGMRKCRDSCDPCDQLQSGPQSEMPSFRAALVLSSSSTCSPPGQGEAVLCLPLSNTQKRVETNVFSIIRKAHKQVLLPCSLPHSGKQPCTEEHGGTPRPGLVNTHRETKERQRTWYSSPGI